MSKTVAASALVYVSGEISSVNLTHGRSFHKTSSSARISVLVRAGSSDSEALVPVTLKISSLLVYISREQYSFPQSIWLGTTTRPSLVQFCFSNIYQVYRAHAAWNVVTLSSSDKESKFSKYGVEMSEMESVVLEKRRLFSILSISRISSASLASVFFCSCVRSVMLKRFDRE